jgi:acetamidase/formamidase
MPQTHHLDKNAIVYRWDRDAPPGLTIDPGDTVVFETPEITRGQIGPDSTADSLLNLDFDLILCSVATDLKISETVDEPNWLVSACMPLGIFEGAG